MSVKEIILNALREMPEDISFEEILRQLRIIAAIHRADEDIASGRLHSQTHIEQEFA